MKDETIFSRNFINEFRLQSLNEVQICRMESNYTQQGIPDIYICYRGVSCWVELKVGANPLSPLQISWHRQHRLAGGMVFTVTQMIEKGGNKYRLNDADVGVWNYNSLTGLVTTIIYYMQEKVNASIQKPF